MKPAILTNKPKKELAPVHDFTAKLLQPSLFPRLKEYVLWQAGKIPAPDSAPVSINLDLTTACNYACPHCIDSEIINAKARFEQTNLLTSLETLSEKGLKSVILLGGGEPTCYSHFEDIVDFLKQRKISLAVSTNGSHMNKIGNVAPLLDKQDWVRLSLDSGTNKTFQEMHRPRIPITLEQICKQVREIKTIFPEVRIGYSYVVTPINTKEIILAARLARDYLFDYISIKPFLIRSENNSEVVAMNDKDEEEILNQTTEAKKLQTSRFRVIESNNLRAIEAGEQENYTKQTRNCHMQYFRQVLSPLGLFNCPACRGIERAKIAGKEAYLPGNLKTTQTQTARLIQDFDASTACRQVTCFYNQVNKFIENLIQHPEKLDSLTPSEERRDYFL